MLGRLPRGVTYADVMATIAVFGVLAGGGAYAASKIGPRDIAKNAVRAKHIKAGSVTRAKLAGDGLKSGETIRGAWGLRGNGSLERTAVSFPVRAPRAVDSFHVVIAGNDTVTGDGCTGTHENPVAARGFVCV